MRLRASGTVLGCVLLANCANSVAPAHSEPPPELSAASQSAAVEATSSRAAPSGIEASAMLDQLLVGLTPVGLPGASSYERDLNTFVAMPDALAVLRQRYEQLRPDHMGRWAYVNLAAKIVGQESLGFLERVAHSAVPASPQQGDDVEMARYGAVKGIVAGYAADAPGYDSALINLLETGDAALARRAGVELFALGKLGEEHAALLTKRGIYAHFTKTDRLGLAAREQLVTDGHLTSAQGGRHEIPR